MDHADIKIGMRVIPLSKTADGRTQGLHSSAVWRMAEKINQPYLYVSGKRPNGDYPEITLSIDRQGKDKGDFFLSSDVVRFEKPNSKINKNIAKKYLDRYFKSQYLDGNSEEFKSLVRILNKKDKTP